MTLPESSNSSRRGPQESLARCADTDDNPQLVASLEAFVQEMCESYPSLLQLYRVTGGWAGDIDLRLRRDVIAYRPTVMTIMLGMNDGSYKAWDESIFKTCTTAPCPEGHFPP